MDTFWPFIAGGFLLLFLFSLLRLKAIKRKDLSKKIRYTPAAEKAQVLRIFSGNQKNHYRE